MTPEQLVLAEVKAQVEAMPADDRIVVLAVACTLRNIIATGGDNARMALALIGAELAAE